MRVANNIFLVGMPGSGKSTVGKLLAEKLGVDFYDLDNEIESDQGKTIAEIFAEGDEDQFRKLESSALQKIIRKENAFVMAAGGGAPCFYDGMNKMSASGLTVYLDTPIDFLITRTKRKRHRPLLRENHAEKLSMLLTARLSCYMQANYILNTADLTLTDKVEKVIRLLEN